MKLTEFKKFTEHINDDGIIKKVDGLGRIVIPIKFRTENKVYLQRIDDYLILSSNNEDGTAFNIEYDNLGRIVIPIEIRNNLDIKNQDNLSVWTYKDNILLKKYEDKCVFCRSANNLTEFKEKLICKKCKEQIVGV